MTNKRILKAVAGISAALIIASPANVFGLPGIQLGIEASALSYRVEAGDFFLYSDEKLELNTDYIYYVNGDHKVVMIVSDKPVTIKNNGDLYDKTTTSIQVAADVDARITFSDLYSDVSQWDNMPAFMIETGSKGNVEITLEGDNTLKSGNFYAGLQKSGFGEDIGKLTIKGDGSLTAIGGMCSAGIGGGCGTFARDGSCANIEIKSGKITAIGGARAAGIGGGDGYDARDICISGGYVNAIAGSDCKNNIGGGHGKSALDTIITGESTLHLFEQTNVGSITVNGTVLPASSDGKVSAYIEGGTLSEPVRITVGDKTSDYIYDTGSKKWLIVADASVTAAENLSFNNKNQALIASSKATVYGATVVYSLEKDGAYSTAAPIGKKEGTYTVWYKIKGDGVFAETEPKSVEVRIGSAETPKVKAAATKNSIKLTWNELKGAKKYTVYKVVNGKAIKLCETKKNYVNIKNLKSGKTYSYIVRALVNGKSTPLNKADIITVKTKK